ncbi:MAG: hypothetical protein KKC37_11035, partial [Proteobacteria bacterium]|nr:hypothetical protein [Pseudomonadota bacterium]
VLWGAIKAHCAECMGSKYQVADCTSPRCSLFLYRLGVGRLAEAAIIPPQAAPNVDPAEVGGGHGEAA